MSAEPNTRLRTARLALGLTQGQLAEAANTRVEAATGKPGAMDADYIGKLERGLHRWPNRCYRDALGAVLRRSADAELGFFSTRARAVTVEGDHPIYPEDGDDVQRQSFLRTLAASVAGFAVEDPIHEFSTTQEHPVRVGAADAKHVHRLARMFADQDHRFGSGLSAQAVLAQLTASTRLLHGRFSDEPTRQRLFAAMADLADVAGGMCFDAGAAREAERCFRFATACAMEAGEWSIRAKALSGLANLAVHKNRAEDALSFAEMALVRADRLTPAVRAVTHTRHARALGLAGAPREGDCLTAIEKAQTHFTNRTPGEPDWIAYYGPAHLDRDIGRALLHLAWAAAGYWRPRTTCVRPSPPFRARSLAAKPWQWPTSPT